MFVCLSEKLSPQRESFVREQRKVSLSPPRGSFTLTQQQQHCFSLKSVFPCSRTEKAHKTTRQGNVRGQGPPALRKRAKAKPCGCFCIKQGKYANPRTLTCNAAEAGHTKPEGRMTRHLPVNGPLASPCLANPAPHCAQIRHFPPLPPLCQDEPHGRAHE